MRIRKSDGHRNRPATVRRARSWGPPLCLGVLLALTAAHPARADDAANAALSTCVNTHLLPEDSQVMIWVVITVLADAQPSESDLHSFVAGRRDRAIGDAAKLLTRLGQSCKPELQAAAGTKPGAAFGQLFGLMMQDSMSSLNSGGGQRAGMLFAIDLMKKLDSGVAVDLFGPGIAGMTGAPSPDNPPPVPKSPEKNSEKSPNKNP